MARMAGIFGCLCVAACGHPHPAQSDATSADVQACFDAVDKQRTFYCTGTARQCLYSALRPLCASDRAAYIEGVFQCLTLDGMACPSPSDPSNGQACIDGLIAMYATATDKALGAAICACESVPETGCSNDLPQYSMATLLFLSESDIATLTSCIQTMGCSQQTACINATPLATANACQC